MDLGTADPNGGNRQQGARRPGRVIPFGKYLLVDRIAVGGMAEVYLAKSFGIEGFEKMLAIKRILPTMAEDQDFIEMFVDEAKIAGQLTHANIVPIFELGKIGESHYIAMEYVWGKDLLQIMNRFRRLRKRMPPAMVAWIATKMCEALDYAHSKRDRRGRPMNIIHRDVSPQNILVSYEGEVKLIDFGIAKAASRTTKTQAGVLKGKFGYMSPEQVRGMPIDHRSDIFAVGTCMYEAMTSERLFLGESDFSTLEKVRNASVAPVMEVAEVPGELNEVVMTALRRDPADRYQTAADLQEALQRYLAKQRPPFGTSKLSSWLKTAFSTEMTREKAKLDSFAHIGRPSVLAGPRKPGLSQTADDRPAAKRPPPRAPAVSAGGAPPPMPRPSAAAPAAGLDDAAPEPNGFEDLEGEATMVSSSPFEDGDAAPEEAAEITEEPTQIFFSADDLEEVADDDAPMHAGGLPSSPPPSSVLRATFRPGRAPQVAAPDPSAAQPRPAPAPMPAPSKMPARQPVPARPAPVPADAPLDPAAFAPSFPAPPEGPVSMKPEATPVFRQGQRHVPTMEISSAEREAAIREATRLGQRRGGRGRTFLLAAIAAVVMLGVGVVAALVLFGGDDVGTIEVRTVPSVGAAVLIDGVPRGRAPLRVERIGAGERQIEVQADGFGTESRTIDVRPGTTAMLEIALQQQAAQPPVLVAQANPPAAAPGEATAPQAEEATAAEAEEAGAADGEEEGAAEEPEPPARAAQEEPREARREAEEPAPREQRAPERVARATPMTERQGPERIPRERRETSGSAERPAASGGSGTLVINSIPWARVFLDGRDTGRNTPIPSMRVRAGTRRVGLRTPDGEMHEFSVEIEAGGTHRLMKRL